MLTSKITNKVYIDRITHGVWDGVKEQKIFEYEIIPINWENALKSYRYRANAVKFCKKNGLEIVEDRK